MQQAYAFAFISCFLHAWWNFRLKKANGGQIFIGLSKIMEAVVFALPFLFLLHHLSVNGATLLRFSMVGAVLTGLNYFSLGRAYAVGDFSVVYPISRSGALLVLPVLGFLLNHERTSLFGLVSIGIIIAGSTILPSKASDWSSLLRTGELVPNKTNLYACLAALTLAAYTEWDRYAVQHVPPFLYLYGYTSLIGVGYASAVISRNAREALAELRKNWWAIVQVGVLNTLSYLLVLAALRTGKPAYVIAIRQLSIAIGAVLGWQMLGERWTVVKQTGLIVLLIGCILVSLAK